MKFAFTRAIGSLVLISAASYSMAGATPTDAPGTINVSPSMLPAPVNPISAAEAASTTPVAPTAPAAAPTTAAAATAPVPAAPAAKSPDEETAAIRQAARTLGLKPRTKNGTEVYCKSFAEIGTRMPTLNCYTKEDVVQLQKNSRSNKDDIENMQRASLTEPNKG